MPTGSPVASAIASTKSSSSSTLPKARVPRRADAVAPRLDAADRRDLRRHLRRRQHPAEARLRALRELDLDRAHRRAGDRLLQVLQREAPLRVAAAEVAGADLEDQLAAVAVVRREPALAGALQAAGEPAALVERLHRRARQRAEAHARDVHERARPERVPRARARRRAPCRRGSRSRGSRPACRPAAAGPGTARA